MLGKICGIGVVNRADSGAEVRALRKTRVGDVLVELGPRTEKKTKFGETLRLSEHLGE